MPKYKCFSDLDLPSLERQVNKFVADNPMYTMLGSGIQAGSSSTGRLVFFCTLMYKDVVVSEDLLDGETAEQMTFDI